MWISAVVVLVILTAIALSYVALAAPIPAPPPADSSLNEKEVAAQELEIARMEAEARRNALATGAGFAAIVALILAFHRQRHHERTTANAEADALRRQQHLERTAAAAEDDALQRRITDARIRAVEQLGSDNPAVRIGGLHNLERIGQQHPELRQVVIDEVCAYLRLPFEPSTAKPRRTLPRGRRRFEPVGPPPVEVAGNGPEREVRLIAQEIIQRHVKIDDEREYWEHSRLNLKNAWLDQFELDGCRLTRADFTNAAFARGTTFQKVTFDGAAVFSGATFRGEATFHAVTFTEAAEFWRVNFKSGVFLTHCDFLDSVIFAGVTLAEDAFFFHSAFTGAATFEIELAKALLPGPKITNPEAFDNARFNASARHRLPKGWRLAPDPARPGWSRAACSDTRYRKGSPVD